MNTDHQVHLPTEIVLEIVRFVAANDDEDRQGTLYACCLISRQWYSAAVAFLYEDPRLDVGQAFQKFTTTICPSISARRSKLNLGCLVRRLDLGRLVHHSSNSRTARLLGRVKENLEVFIAPRVSFSVASIPALSKCLKLRHLDLALVGDPIPITLLEKSLRNLHQLISLRLPQFTSFTVPEETQLRLPPHLERLQISGSFSQSTVSFCSWPSSLKSLTLLNCVDLSVSSLGAILSTPLLSDTLKSLTISYANRGLQPESITMIPVFLPGLLLLNVPGDLVEESFFDLLNTLSPPVALQTLELDHPCSDPSLNFEASSLLTALHRGLSNLLSIGFSQTFVTDQTFLEHEDIDDVLLQRTTENSSLLPGVYYF
ncbi:hypothetical protein ASPZODRAFT_55894 [Penicilliopsis zonata CBS 506.65]|uniref:Uncharacterized protein n=1 Tax=Penicilliopsis zonata CBS 506.65 TaxID=1073090 RepID=A0A1L9SW69_9EURO|nr:hypothetical protein ASPZODRAFT_55894 [Penicilliopsis zonata CBS 506.65]OJJ51351.1 hypothetical protein ASPZODRAFT_55894 [Penicilliopsis zonata CBS 506.65]